MIVREFHPLRINAVLNDPSVLQWVALRGQARPLDLGPLLADPRNVLLLESEGSGGLFFHWQEPGVYEVHTQFLPSARGKVALACTEAALEWMFLRTDAMELHTKVPEHNKAARALVQAIGGTCEYSFGEFNGQKVEHWALRFPEWLWSDGAKGLEAIGSKFHANLERKMAEAGLSHSPHPSDPAHDRVVGATIGMISAGGGNIDKGIILYSRWARLSDYAPMTLLSKYPTIVDIGDALLVADGSDFAVMPRSVGAL